VGDTDANGFLDLNKLKHGVVGSSVNMDLAPFIINSIKQRVVTFITIKNDPTASYALGTLATAANWLKLFAGQPGGATAWWRQSSNSLYYPGSYQAGLIANNRVRYSDTTFTYPNLAHDVLVPSYSYALSGSGPVGFDVPQQAFHTTFYFEAAVTNVNRAISDIHAFPNPANNELTISFALSDHTPVTVSLVNMLGQTAATQETAGGKAVFNIASLAAGIYVYTIQTGSGERATGRVVINH
jgi:hypothetical protein